MPDDKQRSFYWRVFGRSIMAILFGSFFENKNNTAGILAIILVLTLCWAIIFKEKYDYLNGLLNIVFVIIGYYFGAKQPPVFDDNEKD
jgi:predicted membrane protein